MSHYETKTNATLICIFRDATNCEVEKELLHLPRKCVLIWAFSMSGGVITELCQ